MDNFSLSLATEAILQGREGISQEEALYFAQNSSLEELLEASEKVTLGCNSRKFDSCSIINAKSGRCSEDCKWCAQSIHYDTGAPTYPLLQTEPLLRAAKMCHKRGIGRFSFVTSGKRLSNADVESLSKSAKRIKSECSISLCISSGLLKKEQLRKLYESGVSRYHCNLESAPSFFPSLCTTHTQQEKIKTLLEAKECGMEICSGGIIGMGESLEQRIELAFTLKGIGVISIPINILFPIKGTPLYGTPLISEEEILRTIALFRLILPKSHLRFAGGKARISDATLLKAYKCGINASIIGDMLTTAGADISRDVERITEAGYKF